jgi:arylsulfatase A-like enzyme
MIQAFNSLKPMKRAVIFTSQILVAMTFLGAACGDAAQRPPNIVFIFADDHAWQAISAYNDPRKLILTPNIDRLGREGVRFDRCLVPNSICGPSRATVLTGKYSHMNGFYNNINSRFNGEQPTMPKMLRSAGYQTAMIGKWHLETDPTGFDYWEILHGQGVYYNPPMVRMGQNVKHQGYVTEVITGLALDWLRQRDKSKPFLLMCHHKAPHREWEPVLKYLNHDNDRKYPEPPTLFDDYSGRGKAEHQQDMMIDTTMNDKDVKLTTPPDLNPAQRAKWNEYYQPRNSQFTNAHLQGKDLVRWKYNRYMHDYLGCIKSVDESVGDILQYLDEEGLADNTIVVYASDQGFYLGEHGWFDKRWIFEESLRTPLLVRWPGVAKKGSVRKEMVSNVDFAETFLEAAGAVIPSDMQGRSLVPLLRGKAPKDWRQSFYYHYYEHPGWHSVARHYGVVTERYKLVHFYEPEFNYWEMFDLKKDPHELKSVWANASYGKERKKLESELQRLRADLKVPDPDPEETIKAKPATIR